MQHLCATTCPLPQSCDLLTDFAQASEVMIESSLDSAASFNRSALLMYLGLFFGANLALAFLAWAFSSCLIFF